MTPDAPVDLWPCYSPVRSNQQWYTSPPSGGAGGAVSLHSAFDGQCLTAGAPPAAASGSIPFAMVCGRISSYDSCQRGPAACAPPHGYCLHLRQDGGWQLLFASSQLAAGTVELAGEPKAHRLQIKFAGGTLRALIDGTAVASAAATNSSGGMVAIGSGFHNAYFDSLTITGA